MKTEIDWMGRWYTILKERGENDCPTLGRLDLSTGEIDWLRFSHSEMDGVGAFVKYYQKLGITLPNLPQIREKKRPGYWEKIAIMYRLIFKTPKLTTDWKERNEEAAPRDPLHIHWHIFKPEEVAKLENSCRLKGHSLNAYFMNTLTKVLLSELSHNSQGTWTLPVNLRPLVSKADFCSNHSSGILIPVAANDGPFETQKRISRALKSKQHWGVWWVHQVGKIIGMRGMRSISLKNSQKSFLLGSFSILGKWDFPQNHIWIGCPPGSKNFPISAFLLKAQGHLSFCLKIHPYVLKDESKVAPLFQKVIEQIISDAKGTYETQAATGQ